jgi:hypothetical protein
MKFKRLIETDFDPVARTFRFTGESPAGLRQSLDLPVDDTRDFLFLIAATLRKAASADGTMEESVVTHKMRMSAMNGPGELDITLTFQFDVGGIALGFVFPVMGAASPQQRDAISEAFERAARLLEQATVPAQRN